jgi:hypothetical protein
MGHIHGTSLTPHFPPTIFPFLTLFPLIVNALIALSTEICAVSRRGVVRSRCLTLSASFSGSNSCPIADLCAMRCPRATPTPLAAADNFLTTGPSALVSRRCCVAVESHLIDASLYNSDPGREYFGSSRRLKCPRSAFPVPSSAVFRR